MPAGRIARTIWVETPFLVPGDTLGLNLLVRPERLHRTRRCSFKVISQSVEQDHLPLVIVTGFAQVGDISRLRLYWPAILFGLLATATIATIVYWFFQIGIL